MGHIELGRKPCAFAMNANSIEAGLVEGLVICQRNITLQQGGATHQTRLFKHSLDL